MSGLAVHLDRFAASVPALLSPIVTAFTHLLGDAKVSLDSLAAGAQDAQGFLISACPCAAVFSRQARGCASS